MNREDFAAWEQRVRARADLLWLEGGSPEGPRDRFVELARELVAIEENPSAGRLDPDDQVGDLVEEAALMRNLGEFPTLVDQGEEQTFPDEEDDSRLSDGDASDTGGVLPQEDEPVTDLPETSLADADVTSDSLDTGAARATRHPDINDDGLPDQPALDDDDDDGEDDGDEDDRGSDIEDDEAEDIEGDEDGRIRRTRLDVSNSP